MREQPRDERGRWTTAGADRSAAADRAGEVRIIGVQVSPAMRPRVADLLGHLTAGRMDAAAVAEHFRSREWAPGDDAGDSWGDVDAAGLPADTYTVLAAARAETGYV